MKTIDETAVIRFAKNLKQKGRQGATVASYQRDCQAFLGFLADEGVLPTDIASNTLLEFQKYLKNKDQSDNTVRRSMIGVRQFFRFLQLEQGWDLSPFDCVPLPERSDEFNPRVTPAMFDHLVSQIKPNSSKIKSTRDLALLYLLGLEGLKAAELISLTWSDLILNQSAAVLKIRGKRERILHLEPETTLALQEYKSTLLGPKSSTRLDPKSKIMIGFKGSDAHAKLTSLTRHGVKFALYELGQKALIAKLNSEDLRHHAMAHKVAIGFTPEMLLNHLGLRTPGKTSRHFPDALEVVPSHADVQATLGASEQ
jgi:site-specific recombinase XerD